MLGDTAVLGGGGSSGGGGGDESGSGDAVAAIASSGGGGGSHEGAATATAVTTGGGGSNSGDEERGRILEEGERSGSFGGNRWPRQETLALLRIRSDMDVAFRDASVKGPLWDEVSRKMAELGYHRSAKKCKEKFENVYKYHKRTKEGRSGKADGKTYRFFDQLEALENHPPTTHQSPKPPPPQQQHSSLPPTPPPQIVTTSAVPLPTSTTTTPTTTTMAMPPSVPNTTLSVPPPHVTVPSKTTTTTTLPMAMPQGIVTAPSINLPIPSYPPPPTKTINPTNLFPHSTPNPTTTTNPLPHTTIPVSFPNIPTDLLSNSSSFSTSSDETLEGRRKRKRKWKDFFERLMKEVVEKQEQLQKRFLEAIEKREHDRMAREEAWRVQEMQRINRERDMLAQERSIAAAKDAAVMSLLQKIGEQQNLGQALNTINIVQPQPQSQQQPQPQSHPQQQSQPSSQPSAPQAPLPGQQLVVPIVQPAVLPVALAPPQPPQPQPQPQQQQRSQVTSMEIVTVDNNNGENLMPASSSRWPKVEVQALIKLRTSLDAKYQENGPKGPLWEEISSSMRKLGYNRNAKRCKEKWENINKYFKKVKESNKKRPEDSKTCPYFHQLDALYREKNKLDSSHVAAAVVTAAKPESMVAPLMVRPEQQWPPQPGPEVAMEDVENDPMDRHHHDEEDEDDEDEDKDTGDEEDEEDEGGGGGGGGGGNNYEIVSSKPASASMGTATAE